MNSYSSRKNSTGRRVWSAESIARELGIPAAKIEAIARALFANDTEFSDKGKEAILHALERQMGATTETKPASEADGKAKASDIVREDLRLVRIFRGSPRVLAERSNGNEVVLQVKTSEQLESGMVLKGCEQGEMCWFYTGRLPRISGERQLYFPARPETLSSHE